MILYITHYNWVHVDMLCCWGSRTKLSTWNACINQNKNLIGSLHMHFEHELRYLGHSIRISIYILYYIHLQFKIILLNTKSKLALRCTWYYLIGISVPLDMYWVEIAYAHWTSTRSSGILKSRDRDNIKNSLTMNCHITYTSPSIFNWRSVRNCFLFRSICSIVNLNSNRPLPR